MSNPRLDLPQARIRHVVHPQHSTFRIASSTEIEKMFVPSQRRTRSRKPFNFLHLPKELRLDIYDCLIEREHQERSNTIGGESAKVTFVPSNSIPPIHLTCKQLYDEVTAYLRPKISDMAEHPSTPRLIVHESPSRPLVRLVNEVFLQLAWAQILKSSPAVKEAGRPLERAAHDTLEDEVKVSSITVCRSNGSFSSFLTDLNASYLMKITRHMDHPSYRMRMGFPTSGQLRAHTPPLSHTLNSTDESATEPRQTLHVAISGKHVDFDLSEFLPMLGISCATHCRPAVVYIARPDNLGSVMTRNLSRWLDFKGEVDAKVWPEGAEQ